MLALFTFNLLVIVRFTVVPLLSGQILDEKVKYYRIVLHSRETTLLIRPLPVKAAPLIRPDFRCTEKVKYYRIVLHSRETTHLIRLLFHYRRSCLIREKLLNTYVIHYTRCIISCALYYFSVF